MQILTSTVTSHHSMWNACRCGESEGVDTCRWRWSDAIHVSTESLSLSPITLSDS